MRWTEDQERVIGHKGGNLLVSAAAGSGKTAVLVEHIIRRLTDPEQPLSLSEMLVMTFTDAAAQEMRDRIKAALQERLRQDPENRMLVREAGNIQNANICTIDSFCKRLITENYALLDLDPAFRIGDEGELKLLEGDLLRELMEERYLAGDAAYLRFVDSFSRGKEDAGIEELVRKVHGFAMANPWPEEYLSGNGGGEETAAEAYLLRQYHLRIADFLRELGLALCMAQEEDGPSEYIPMLRADYEAMEELLSIDSMVVLSDALSAFSFPRLKTSRAAGREAVSGIRNGVKKSLQSMAKRCKTPDGEMQERICQGVRENAALLRSLARDFHDRYQAAKRSRRMLDFSDLEHYALQLLYEGEGAARHPSALSDEYARGLREILVDEYQDSNYVQEALVEALSAARFGRPDVFQVGDVKQSIYSFRLARPDLFLQKYEDPAYPKLELSVNFRSRKPVLDAANALFFRIMRPELGGIRYTEEVSLHLGRVEMEEAAGDGAESPEKPPGGTELSEETEPIRGLEGSPGVVGMPERETDAGNGEDKGITELWLLSLDAEEDEGAFRLGAVADASSIVLGAAHLPIADVSESASSTVLGAADPPGAEMADAKHTDSEAGLSADSAGLMAKEEAEARLIAMRIHRLLSEGYHYRDIVILMRSPGSWADTVVEVLSSEGIPAYSVSNEGYFAAVEMETVLSLLSIIDNPRQPIPLAAVMRSPIYGFTDAELAEIVISQGSLERAFPEDGKWRDGVEGEDGEKGEGREEGAAQDGAVRAADAAREGETQTGDGYAESRQENSEQLNRGQTENAPAFGIPQENAALPPALREKLEDFYRDLAHFREMARYLRIHELLYRIYEETGYYHYASAMPAGERRRANLDQLIDSAIAFEQTSYTGLFDFIRYIEKLKKYNADRGEASVYSEEDDLVRILSIHRSKGLQFPVVFLSGLARRFNKMDLSAKVLIDPVLGIATDYIDPDARVRYPSIQRLAVRERLESEQLGEELRVLYVGMTRAMDKLILTAAVPDAEKLYAKYREGYGRGFPAGNLYGGNEGAAESQPLEYGKIREASCMLDWILMAENPQDMSMGLSPIRLYTLPLPELLSQGRGGKKRASGLWEGLREAVRDFPEEDAVYQDLQAKFAYQYPFSEATRLFPKYSVSEIKAYSGNAPWEGRADALPSFRPKPPQFKKEASVTAVPIQEAFVAEVSVKEALEIPAVWQAASEKEGGERGDLGARIGDAYHHALAAYDYGQGFGQLAGRIPAEELALIDERRFRAFLESPLGQQFREAQAEGQLFREQHFMKLVPYEYLFPESGLQEEVMLQGVIDAFILRPDGIVLVDYKTDRVRDAAALSTRYATQLRLYADALREITGKEILEKWIYSFHLGREILI